MTVKILSINRIVISNFFPKGISGIVEFDNIMFKKIKDGEFTFAKIVTCPEYFELNNSLIYQIPFFNYDDNGVFWIVFNWKEGHKEKLYSSIVWMGDGSNFTKYVKPHECVNDLYLPINELDVHRSDDELQDEFGNIQSLFSHTSVERNNHLKELDAHTCYYWNNEENTFNADPLFFKNKVDIENELNDGEFRDYEDGTSSYVKFDYLYKIYIFITYKEFEKMQSGNLFKKRAFFVFDKIDYKECSEDFLDHKEALEDNLFEDNLDFNVLLSDTYNFINKKKSNIILSCENKIIKIFNEVNGETILQPTKINEFEKQLSFCLSDKKNMKFKIQDI